MGTLFFASKQNKMNPDKATLESMEHLALFAKSHRLHGHIAADEFMGIRMLDKVSAETYAHLSETILKTIPNGVPNFPAMLRLRPKADFFVQWEDIKAPFLDQLKQLSVDSVNRLRNAAGFGFLGLGSNSSMHIDNVDGSPTFGALLNPPCLKIFLGEPVEIFRNQAHIRDDIRCQNKSNLQHLFVHMGHHVNRYGGIMMRFKNRIEAEVLRSEGIITFHFLKQMLAWLEGELNTLSTVTNGEMRADASIHYRGEYFLEEQVGTKGRVVGFPGAGA